MRSGSCFAFPRATGSLPCQLDQILELLDDAERNDLRAGFHQGVAARARRTALGLDGRWRVRNPYRMKATTMTISSKRQTVFPQEWCERVGLGKGGPVNAFDLEAAAGIVNLALRKVRGK